MATERLPIEDQDLINLRVKIEVLSRTDKAPDLGTKLGGFMYLAEPWLTTSKASSLVGIDEGQMYQLMLGQGTIPPEAESIINGLYTVGALIVRECTGIEEVHAKLRAARAKLTRPLSTLRRDPEDPSSKDRSIMVAIKDGDLEKVLSMADFQLGDPKNE